MLKPYSAVHTQYIPILQCLPTVCSIRILPPPCFHKLNDKTSVGKKHTFYIKMEIDSLDLFGVRPLNGVGGSPRESAAEVAILNSGIVHICIFRGEYLLIFCEYLRWQYLTREYYIFEFSGVNIFEYFVNI